MCLVVGLPNDAAPLRRGVRGGRATLDQESLGVVGQFEISPLFLPSRGEPLDLAGIGEVGDQASRELKRVPGGRAGRGPVGLGGAIGHLLERGIVAHPLQRDEVPGALAGQPQGNGSIVLGHPGQRTKVPSGRSNGGSIPCPRPLLTMHRARFRGPSH